MKTSNLPKILSLVIVVIFLIVVGLMLPRAGSHPADIVPVPQKQVSQVDNNDDAIDEGQVVQAGLTVDLKFEFSDEDFENYKNVKIVSGESLVDLLFRLNEQGDINLTYQDYGDDLGIFIKSINGIGDNGGNKWWQFWVNGQFSQVGVSAYKINSGDNILFKYTQSKF